MAEKQAAEYDQVVQDLSGLLANEAVPVNVIDIERKDAMQFVPKTKVNMCYIVMTVLFNESNQVLMVQEAKKSCSGSWYLPAGRLEPNESLVEGAKREVKEEAGMECDITTLLSVHVDGPRWIRFNFFGVITGGRLKTLAEKDEESLQAAFYDVHTIFSWKINLRSGDILTVIRQALNYKESLASVPIHPELLPVLASHSLLLHRIVLVADLGGDAGLQMLICSRGKSHIITSAISPKDSGLFITIEAIVKEAILDEVLCLAIHGVLGVEHCVQGGGKDGVCITTLVSLDLPPETGLPATRDKLYTWIPITKESHINTIRRGMEGHLVKCISK